MDAGRVKPRIIAPAVSATSSMVLSDDERKVLETKYTDLLLEHTRTTPQSQERRKVRKELGTIATQLGITQKKVTNDIRHYGQARSGGQTIRQSLSTLGVYSPYYGF